MRIGRVDRDIGLYRLTCLAEALRLNVRRGEEVAEALALVPFLCSLI